MRALRRAHPAAGLLLGIILLLATILGASAWRAPPLPLRPTTTPRRTLSPLPHPQSRRVLVAPRPAATIPIAAVATSTSSIPFPATLAGGGIGALAMGLQASPWWTWTMLLLASTAGVAAERTRLGAALSSPLITMGVALIGCNLGLLPAAAPVSACAYVCVRISRIYTHTPTYTCTF